MAHHFVIPKRAFDGLITLIDIGPNRLDRLAEEVRERELTLNLESLAAELGTAIGFEDSPRMERAVSTVLIPVSGLRARFGMSPADFMQIFTKQIERQNQDWYVTNGEKWASVVPVCGKLIAPDGYYGLLHKTIGLLENRPAALEEVSILTEIRPVYDEEVTATRALLLTSNLVVSYTESGGESRRLHLTLGQQDLRNLQEQLDRAEKKVRVFEEMAGQISVPLLIAGASEG